MGSTFRVAVLPGDGVGPEVTSAAAQVLEKVLSLCGETLEMNQGLIGAAALRATGSSLTEATLRICEASDAILLGAVGDPSYDLEGEDRPERSILGLRAEFELYANLRPIKASPAMADRTPFKREIAEAVDLMIIRELNGGLYNGDRQEASAGESAFDTMRYEYGEIERIAEVAFRIAGDRNGHVTSIDKANVLASMRQWRNTVNRTAEKHGFLRLKHHLVDSFAMQMLLTPAQFDVVLTPNMFGDILSDEAAAMVGSLGLLPSASIGDGSFGLYEPVHGSAPTIAGQGVANPIGAILSVAMMLRHSFDLEYAAQWVESAVESALDEGLATPDIAENAAAACTTEEMTQGVLSRLEAEYFDRQVPMMVV